MHRSPARRRAAFAALLIAVAATAVQAGRASPPPPTPGPAPAEIVCDPSGRASIELPSGWSREVLPSGLRLRDPEGAVDAYLLVLPGASVEAGLLDAWREVRDGPPPTATGLLRPPPEPGVEASLCVAYRAPPDRVLLALGQAHDGLVYAFLLDASAEAYARRAAQIATLASSLRILALPPDLEPDADALPFGDALADDVRTFLTDGMRRMGVPGAVVAVVQDDAVVWLEAFGVAEAGRPEPLAVDAQFLIGSASKTLTTLMMASLVDEGRFSWDTPVAALAPDFALADPDRTAALRVRHLVCACAGVPRRDLELVFNARVWTAEDAVASLAGTAPYTALGETYQYSNQMVAAGGYLAARAAGPPDATPLGLLPGYAAELQRRVLTPVGMPATTVSFLAVAARGNHASPHGVDLVGAYHPLPVSAERFVLPVAPAAGLWSTAPDLARYVRTLLAGGVAPDGTRVVSREGIETLWEPQVRIRSDLDYGLGWTVGRWHGLRYVAHSGATFGFSSTLALLPDANVGVVVLANARGAGALTEAVAERVFARLFGRAVDDVDADFAFALETRAAARAATLSHLRPDPDGAAPASHVGRFVDPRLGAIEIGSDAGGPILDTGEHRSRLLRSVDPQGRVRYVATEPPLAGLALDLAFGAAGEPEVRIDDPVAPYRFTAP